MLKKQPTAGMHHVDNNSMYARTYDKSKRCPPVHQELGIKTFKYTYQSKKITILSPFLSIGHIPILRKTKYLKLMQHNIEKNKTVINWSRYKRFSPYHVIESIKVVSL